MHLRSTRMNHSEEKRVAAVWCFIRGMGYKATASLINVPKFTVRDWQRQWRRGNFQPDNGRLSISAEKQRTIVELHADGVPMDLIAEKVGCSTDTARRYYQRYLMDIVRGSDRNGEAVVPTLIAKNENMFNIRKESWSDVKRTAEKAVYSDMRVSLYLDYRKLECLKAGLQALDADKFATSDVMKNARTVLLQDINNALAEIDGEADRFKNLLDTAFKSKTLNQSADWVASGQKTGLSDEEVRESPVYDIDTQA